MKILLLEIIVVVALFRYVHSMFFIILNASSKEDFEFLLESVNQWDTLCTYHYLNIATTTIISTSNIFINNNRKKMSTINI